MLEGWKQGFIQFGVTIGVCIFAVLFVFWIGSHEHDQIGPANQNNSNLKQDKPYPKNFDQSGKTVALPDIYTPDHPSHANHYEHQDLKQQTSMADSTKAIVDLTQISLLLGAVGAAAIFWTLLETRRAVAVTREVGDAQTRPWLTAGSTDVLSVDGLTVGDQHFDQGLGIRVNWANVGKSPAVKASVRVCSKVIPRDSKIPKFDAPEHSSSTVIGPGTHAYSENQLMWGDNLSNFLNQQCDFIVYSRVDYEGVLIEGKSFHTEATFRVKHNGYKNNGEHIMPAYIDGLQNSIS